MATSEQADITAGRTVRIGTATHAAAPTDGTTEPDVVLGPTAPGGTPTSGFLFSMTAPATGAATALAGNFTVTIWARDPALKRWAAFEAKTGVDFRQLYVTADVDAVELFFQIGNVNAAGNIDVMVAEQ